MSKTKGKRWATRGLIVLAVLFVVCLIMMGTVDLKAAAFAGGLPFIGIGGFAALAADRNTPRRDGQQISMGVGAGKKIYAGALIIRNATGYAIPGAAIALANGIGVGRAAENVDNTAGADGTVNVLVDCYGAYRFGNSAAGDLITIAHIGKPCYVVDDQTVALTSNAAARCVAGMIQDVDATGVWVMFPYNGFAPA